MAAKRQRREKKNSIEDLYRNRHFVPPKEQNLETIFEEPRHSKNGEPILTSVKKYKRYLHFDPTQNKIQKRKRKAKKCVKRLKTSYHNTRSSPKKSKCDDISLYILDALGDSSSDSDVEVSHNKDSEKTCTDTPTISTRRCLTVKTRSSLPELSCSNLFDIPKRRNDEPLSSDKSAKQDDLSKALFTENEFDGKSNPIMSFKDSQELNEKKEDADELESPKKSCHIT